MAMVSVILPTCNKKDELLASLDTILGQSYRNFELIVMSLPVLIANSRFCDVGDRMKSEKIKSSSQRVKSNLKNYI